MSINFSGTRLGPWKQDGKDNSEGMWYKWEDGVGSVFWERTEKKEHTVRRTGSCRGRTVITGRATDSVLKGMQGNFIVIVQKYLLLPRRVMIDDSFLKNETFSSEWFWRVWKERTDVYGKRSCLDGSDYKCSCFCSQHLQNLLNKNLSDREM